MKFNVGDKVRIKNSCSGAIAGNVYELQWGSTGGKFKNELWARDKEVRNCGCSCQYNWELVTNKNNMTKLNTMMKRVLDPQMRTLIKAGIINGDLEFTEEGRNTLFAILFAANKEELVKVAKEIIAEQKEDCCN